MGGGGRLLVEGVGLVVTTYLFVPAHDDRKTAKALASSTDAIILDLEDAVPDGMKATAREAAARTVRDAAGAGPQLWVRINGAQTPYHEDDLRTIDWSRANGVLLAKAEDPAVVRGLGSHGVRGVVLIMESALGLERVHDLIAASPAVSRLTLGQYDFALDLGLPVDDPDDSDVMWHVRSRMVLASRADGLLPPVDAMYARIGDLAGLESRARRAHRMGFGAKLLIHPEQIAVVHRVFGIDPARLQDARELVAAYEAAERDGKGATTFRGELIDRVHVERARALLARWDEGQARA